MKWAFQKKGLQALTSIKPIDFWKFRTNDTVLIKIKRKLKEPEILHGALLLLYLQSKQK